MQFRKLFPSLKGMKTIVTQSRLKNALIALVNKIERHNFNSRASDYDEKIVCLLLISIKDHLKIFSF